VDSRLQPSKSPTFNSPILILFVNQREIPKFPQNILRHLATLFSVRLRVHPFSKNSSKNPIPQKLSKPPELTTILANFRGPIIKGQRPDLILSVTRFNVTHILISSLIQNTFSHKFLKLF
jgi:hypothetical protein